MTDENENENEEHGMAFSFFAGSEGLAEAFAQHIDRSRMTRDAMMHELMDFIRGLTKDQLETFRHFTIIFRSSPESALVYQGIATMLLEQEHGLCAACGQDHDADLRKMTEREPMKTRPWSEVKAESEAKMTPEQRAEYDAEVERLAAQERIKDSQIAYQKNLAEYGLEVIPENGRLMCTNCGMGYISLEDRMLREPGVTGCDGCIQKTKHG